MRKIISIMLISISLYSVDQDICKNRENYHTRLKSAIYLNKKAREENSKRKMELTNYFIIFYGLAYNYCNYKPKIELNKIEKIENDYDSWG